MATNNSVNSPLTGTTGTGNFVGSTSPTLTTPKIGQINDTNGNIVLGLGAVASAVNYISASNNATGSFPYFVSTGTDTNINFGVYTKGTGQVLLLSANTTQPLVVYSGTSYQHTTTFEFSNTAASRTVTFPDATGNVVLSSSTTAQAGNIGAWVFFNGTGTPAVTASGNVTSITDNGVGLYTVNITTALASANYTISGSASGGTGNASQAAVFSSDDGNAARTTTAFRIEITQIGGTAANYYDSATISAIAIL